MVSEENESDPIDTRIERAMTDGQSSSNTSDSSSDSSDGSDSSGDDTAEVTLTDVQGKDGYRLTEKELNQRLRGGSTEDLSQAEENTADQKDRNQIDSVAEDVSTTTGREKKSDANLTGIQGKDGFRKTEEQVREELAQGNTSLEAAEQSSVSAIQGSLQNRRRILRERRQEQRREQNRAAATTVPEITREKVGGAESKLREFVRENPEVVRQARIADNPQNSDQGLSGIYGDQQNIDEGKVKKFNKLVDKANLSKGEVNTLVGEVRQQSASKELANILETGLDTLANPPTNKDKGLSSIFDRQDSSRGDALNLADGEDKGLSGIYGDQNTSEKFSGEKQREFIATGAGQLAAVPFIPQRRGGQAQQIASGELGVGEATAATAAQLQQTAKTIKQNPQKSSLVLTGSFITGSLTGASTSRITGFDIPASKKAVGAAGKTVEKAAETGKKVKKQAGKSEPGQTPTIRDFVEGDLGERPKTPKEVKETTSEEDILMGRNVPDIQESRPTTERNRREFLKEFGLPTGNRPEDLAGKEFTPGNKKTRVKNILGNKRKGSAQLVNPLQKTKEKVEDFDSTGKDISIQDRIDKFQDRIRSPSNDRGNILERNRRDSRRTEFNKPEKPGSDLDNAASTGLGLGLGQGVDNSLDQPQAQDQNQDQTQRQPPEQQQEQRQGQDQGQRSDPDTFLDPDQILREDNRKDRDDQENRRRRKDRDFDLGFEPEQQKKENRAGLLAPGKGFDLDRSLGADLLGIESDVTEEEAEQLARKQKGVTRFQTPFGLRAFKESKSKGNNQERIV